MSLLLLQLPDVPGRGAVQPPRRGRRRRRRAARLLSARRQPRSRLPLVRPAGGLRRPRTSLHGPGPPAPAAAAAAAAAGGGGTAPSVETSKIR